MGAFCITAALESYNMIFNEAESQDFSPQYLLDCDTTREDDGCNGGNYDDGYTFTAEQGVVPLDSYPYTAKQGECKADDMLFQDLVQMINTDVEFVPSEDNDALVAAIQNQPVSVAVDGTNLQLYFGG